MLSYAHPLYAQMVFNEISVSSGMVHYHQSNSRMGGGVAIFDYDNDGWEDIYFTGGESSDRLYRNLGNGSFQDVSIAAGIADFATNTSFGVTTGDIDNDGYRDILITAIIGNRDILLHNTGSGTFTELALPDSGLEYWSTAAAFGDVDLDGHLDIYITSYVDSTGFILDTTELVVGFAHGCGSNRLYINNGDLTFTDATAIYSLEDEGCALAVAFSDFDNDLDADVVLSNDFGEWVLPNGLFENEYPAENYSDVSLAQNMDVQMYGMGVAIGDYDHDLDLDYYQTNLGLNRLSRNDQGTFSDQTYAAGVENDSINGLNTTGWGCFFADMDNDGWQDLYVANGHIPAAIFIANEEFDPNRLYRNNGDGTFQDVTQSSGTGTTRISRGAAYGDLNKDGLLDIVVNNIDDQNNPGQVGYYTNVTQNDNHWLRLKLRGVQSNRDGYGSHIKVVAGGESWIQEVNGGSSHASQNSSIVHIGLGLSDMVDSIVITFPSGIERVFTDVNADQLLNVPEDVTVGLAPVVSGSSAELIHPGGEPMVILRSSGPDKIVLRCYDAAGRGIFENEFSVQNGNNTLPLPGSLGPGVYFVQLTGHNWHWVSNLWIVR